MNKELTEKYIQLAIDNGFQLKSIKGFEKLKEEILSFELITNEGSVCIKKC